MSLFSNIFHFIILKRVFITGAVCNWFYNFDPVILSNNCQLNVWQDISTLHAVQNGNSSHRLWVSFGIEFHLEKARTELCLALADISWLSLGPGTTKRFFPSECNALLGYTRRGGPKST